MACTYLADNSELHASTRGIAYRESKNLDDRKKDGETVSWGSYVVGTEEGDHWLRVGSYYLPMRVSGCRILKKGGRADNGATVPAHLDSSVKHPEVVKTTAAACGGICPCFAWFSHSQPSSGQEPKAVPEAVTHPETAAACSVVKRCAELADEQRLSYLQAEIMALEAENADVARLQDAGDNAPRQYQAEPMEASSTAKQEELAALEAALRRTQEELHHHRTSSDSAASTLQREQDQLQECRQMRRQEEEQLREYVRHREEANQRHEEELLHHRRLGEQQRAEAESAAERLRAEHEQTTQRLRAEHTRGVERMQAEHEQLRIEHEEERRRLEAEMHHMRELHRVEQEKLHSEQHRMQEALIRQQNEEKLYREGAARRQELARREEEAAMKRQREVAEESRRAEEARREEEAAAKRRREEAARYAEEAQREEEAARKRRRELEEEQCRQAEVLSKKHREEAAAKRAEEARREEEEFLREAQRRREKLQEDLNRQRAKDEEMQRARADLSRTYDDGQPHEREGLPRDEEWRRRDGIGATPYASSPIRSHALDRLAQQRASAITPRSFQDYKDYEASTLPTTASSLSASSRSRSTGKSMVSTSNTSYPFATKANRSSSAGRWAKDTTVDYAPPSGQKSNTSGSQSGKRHQISNLLADLDKLAGDLQSVFTHSNSPSHSISVTAVPVPRTPPKSPVKGYAGSPI